MYVCLFTSKVKSGLSDNNMCINKNYSGEEIMSEAIVFIIGAISGIFIISYITKSKLDQLEQGSFGLHPGEETETDDSQNRVVTSPRRQQKNLNKIQNS